MAQARRSIPKTVVDRVLSSTGHQCCFPTCFIEDVQLHHIDGDPSNNSEENLIPLCPNHHAEVEKAKSNTRVSRGYSPDELATYKLNQKNAVSSAGRLSGKVNNQGVATGVLATRLSDVGRVHKATGSKVILVADSATALLSFGHKDRDKIAGIITRDYNEHFMLQAADHQLPVVANMSLPPETYLQYPSVEIDSAPGGGIRNLTFSPKFIASTQQAYERSLERNILLGTSVPSQLINFFNIRCLKNVLAHELARWGQEWGGTAETVRFAIPQIAKRDFKLVADALTILCAEYQWPVGRDNARSVLPQLLRMRKSETLYLLRSWIDSDNLLLVKSVSMIVGTLALIDWDFAISLVERVLGHTELTVVKEAARAIPLFEKVNKSYARELRQRCLRIPDLRPIELATRMENHFGTTFSSIPILIETLQTEGLDDIQRVVQRIKAEGIGNMNLNVARNYIFRNLIPIFEVDRDFCRKIVDSLKPFTLDLHVQLEIVLSWA